MHAQFHGDELPSRRELEEIFLLRYGLLTCAGWAPRRRWHCGYFLPAEIYEALVAKVVFAGCCWLDIGGGRNIFPDNPRLAESLVAHCAKVVAVDPSSNVHQNIYVHQRVQCLVEDYHTDQQFDVVTLRMVAEHIAEPARVVQALRGLVRLGGIVIIFTVNVWSPLSLIAWGLPFRLHHPLKKLFWGGEESDTFHVEYKMNSRRRLQRLFIQHHFREVAFAYLDDLSTFSQFRSLGYIELFGWMGLHKLGLRYPENCLLGIYRNTP